MTDTVDVKLTVRPDSVLGRVKTLEEENAQLKLRLKESSERETANGATAGDCIRRFKALEAKHEELRGSMHEAAGGFIRVLEIVEEFYNQLDQLKEKWEGMSQRSEAGLAMAIADLSAVLVAVDARAEKEDQAAEPALERLLAAFGSAAREPTSGEPHTPS